MHPEQEFYLREFANHFHLSPRQVSLELSNLRKMDLIKKRISGNLHYYSVNQKHPLFSDLRNIFIKTVGLKDVLQEYLVPYSDQIVFCFVYGSLAKGEVTASSDIDVLIIGDVSSRKISGGLIQAGVRLDREINYSIFPLKEVKNRLKKKDHFFNTLLHEPKIFILGNADEFERMGTKWLVKTP